jgi:signal transduction histidine kinase
MPTRSHFTLPLWRLLVALCAALWLSPGHAQMRLGEITLVRDVSGQMTLEEVQRASTEPFKPPYLRLVDRSIVWLRVPLEPVQGDDQPSRRPGDLTQLEATQSLRALVAFATQAQLYDPWPNERGVSTPLSPTLNQHAMHQTFTLPIAPGVAPRALWLRLQPNGPLLVSLGLHSAAQRSVIDSRGLFFHGLVGGLSSAFFLLAIAGLALERSPLMIAWVAKQSANLTMAILNVQWAVEGKFSHSYLLTPSVEWELVRHLNAALSLWFFYVLLRQFSGPPWTRQLHQVFFISIAIGLCAHLLGYTDAARAMMITHYGAGFFVIALTGAACVLQGQMVVRPIDAPRNLLLGLSVGVLFGIAWLSCFPIGFYNVLQTGPALFLLVSAFTSTAFVLMLVWRQRNQTVARQAAAELQVGLADKALQLERDERERQQEFMVMLTHELKAPLSTLGMVLQSSGGSPSMRHHADNALGTMRRVIDHCAKAIRLEEADLPLVRQACSLPVQLQLRIDALLPHERSRIRIDAIPALPDLPADLDALTVVLSNLLDNALKYSPKDSPIRAVFGCDGHGSTRYQTLTIANQPMPGPLPQPDQLFSKYYRGEGPSRVGGSGLGLYLSRALAQRMQGDLVCSLAQHEVRFTLTLPQ